MIEHHYSTAGSPTNEQNDCTVRSLTISTGKPYQECYRYLFNCGRKPNKGFVTERMFKKKTNYILGSKFEKLPFRKKITLNKFLQKHPEGTYYVKKRGHVFVIKDSVVIDMLKPQRFCRIIKAWEVTPAS